MKTEKEFADFFIESYRTKLSTPQSTTADEDLAQIAKNHWTDLTTHLNSYFSNEDRLQITQKAAELLAQHTTSENLSIAWTHVIRDFYTQNSWGFKTVTYKPKLKKTEEQKIFWKLFKYGWAFFQSMIVLKIAVYYFGLESAERPEDVSQFWVWLFFGISVGSLAFFAYRNRNETD